MKPLFPLLLCLISSSIVFSQTSSLNKCDTIFVAQLPSDNYTKERTVFVKVEAAHRRLIYEYCDRRPLHGSHCYKLTIDLLDISKWPKGTILDLTRDTSAVKARAETWSCDARLSDITGTVKVVKHKILGIKLELDLLVIPRGSSNPIVYKGRAVFRQSLNLRSTKNIPTSPSIW